MIAVLCCSSDVGLPYTWDSLEFSFLDRRMYPRIRQTLSLDSSSPKHCASDYIYRPGSSFIAPVTLIIVVLTAPRIEVEIEWVNVKSQPGRRAFALRSFVRPTTYVLSFSIAHAAHSVFGEQQYVGTYIYSPTVHGPCRDLDMLKEACRAFCL